LGAIEYDSGCDIKIIPQEPVEEEETEPEEKEEEEPVVVPPEPKPRECELYEVGCED